MEKGKFAIAVKAILARKSDGKVLILRRSKDKRSYPGVLDLPGGRVEYDEPLRTALMREVSEETGISIRLSGPFRIWQNNIGGQHFLGVTFAGDALSEDVSLSDEHDEALWIDEHDLGGIETRGVRDTLELYFEKRAQGFKFEDMDFMAE